MSGSAARAPGVRPVRVVLDTNVLVSALLTPGRAPARVLDLVAAGDLIPLFDERVVAEYWSVLTRPRFPFDHADIARLIRAIEEGEYIVGRPLPAELPDPDDIAFAEVALAGHADALVTGNARHFAPAGHLVRVRSPRELLVELEPGG